MTGFIAFELALCTLLLGYIAERLYRIHKVLEVIESHEQDAWFHRNKERLDYDHR